MTTELTTVQQGWLKLAEIRNTLFNDLQLAELQVQQLTANGTASNNLEEVKEVLINAKKVIAEAKEKRLAFSRMIDEKLLTPAIQYEKRAAEKIQELANHELNLRKEEEEKAQKANAILSEEAEFKAFFLNEGYRIAAEFRGRLAKFVNEAYQLALKTQMSLKDIPAHLLQYVEIFKNEKPLSYKKFERKLISQERAMELYNTVPKFQYEAAINEAISDLHKRFENYELDLANAEAAIEAAKKEAEKKEEEQAKKLAEETAVNNLMAKAEAATIDAPKIKRELKIEFENTQSFAALIIANFLKNMIDCIDYIRVKNFENLTVGQMADALAKLATETGEKIANVKYVEVCK